ncbi:hypothetical protein [Luteimonas sp. MHLX1A]|uniref:hypothetical protein n=1 Tax=Alterluteimonas muca TaxID=2878684 RepID=UPI001E2FA5DE|nr:hypothetical protein [Luteimonas sp. MHLX1A]MCD9047787.1 hypothetical protein [Luteimonas sp. MHLX1A]
MNRAQLTAKLRDQLNATPWLRWALLLIGVLAAVLGLQGLESLRSRAQDMSIEQEARLRQIRSLQGQDVWIARQRESAELHESLLAEIPSAPTSGVAQAAVQGWLAGLGNSIADTESVRISVEGAAPVESMPGLFRIRATLRAGMTAREALNVARQIESSANLVVIESAEIRSDVNQLASFGVNAFYRIAPADQQATQ